MKVPNWSLDFLLLLKRFQSPGIASECLCWRAGAILLPCPRLRACVGLLDHSCTSLAAMTEFESFRLGPQIQVWSVSKSYTVRIQIPVYFGMLLSTERSGESNVVGGQGSTAVGGQGKHSLGLRISLPVP